MPRSLRTGLRDTHARVATDVRGWRPPLPLVSAYLLALALPLRKCRQDVVLSVLVLQVACGSPLTPLAFDQQRNGSACTTGSCSDGQFLVALFDSALTVLRDSADCSGVTNEDGSLAWAESYVLEALLDAFEATEDPRYLDEFVIEAANVLAATDIRRHVFDYRNRMRFGWSATRYSVGGQRVVWLVHSGMIAAPLVRFALLVRERPKIPVRHRSVAREYYTTALRALAVFSTEYQEDARTGEGQYLLEAGAPVAAADSFVARPLPLNQDAVAGYLHLLVWRMSGSQRHLRRALAIGRRLRNHLIPVENRYVWRYWGADGQRIFNAAWEDISHGALDVQFAHALFTEGLLFDQRDMLALSQTLLSRSTGTGFLRRVEGDEPDITRLDPKCQRLWRRRYSDASGRWLALSSVSPDLYEKVSLYMVTRVRTIPVADPQLLLGLARLAKMQGKQPAPAGLAW